MKINLCKCGCGNLCEQNYIKGHGRKGKKNTVEHNLKISLANKGRIITKEEKERLGNLNINKKHTEETKLKISKIAKEKGFGKWMIGKKMSKETKIKLSEIKEGHLTSEETKRKISIANLGENNGMFGRTHSDEYKEILRQNAVNFRKNAHTLKAIEKQRLKKIGKTASVETKQKMRISAINYIINKNGGVCTMHNINACKYLDKLSKENNWNLQHAENGGEYHIKELGYFVDGYDMNKNIVVEYDEPLHYYKNGELKSKDNIRQNEIINYLKCKFFRYNEKKGILYEII
jgi:hypothetical protein